MSTEDISEQYAIMAQMEANIRVKDNTGFDMDEYKEQVKQLEKDRLQEEFNQQARYHTKLKAKLPDAPQSEGSLRPSDRPEEPPLPFTRANRRYVQMAKGNNGRERVPELCLGVVVPQNSKTDRSEHIVICWGCTSYSGKYLKANALATLVQCPECLTISPVNPQTL